MTSLGWLKDLVHSHFHCVLTTSCLFWMEAWHENSECCVFNFDLLTLSSLRYVNRKVQPGDGALTAPRPRLTASSFPQVTWKYKKKKITLVCTYGIPRRLECMPATRKVAKYKVQVAWDRQEACPIRLPRYFTPSRAPSTSCIPSIATQSSSRTVCFMCSRKSEASINTAFSALFKES